MHACHAAFGAAQRCRGSRIEVGDLREHQFRHLPAIGDDGGVTGHVDLGALGVADRWADIAVAAMSTEWNYGPGWDGALVDAYGVAADHERLAYYRDLWNAT